MLSVNNVKMYINIFGFYFYFVSYQKEWPGRPAPFNTFIKISSSWGLEGLHTLLLLPMDDAEEEVFCFATGQS